MPWDENAAKRLGQVLRQLRQEKGLSQEALAFHAGVTKNQLQLIEAGSASGRKNIEGPSNPKLATLVGLAEVLGVQLSTLLSQSDL